MPTRAAPAKRRVSSLDALRRAGFRNTDISILFPENVGTKDFAHEKGTKAPEGVTAGAGTGAVIDGALGWLLVAVAVAGFLFSWWARLHLGALWSGTVTRKEGHHVIDMGPYHFVRHPIYTGFLTAVLGDALILGEVRGLVALAVLFLTWTIKSNLEERMMYERFGAEYIDYRSRVKGLVPFVY